MDEMLKWLLATVIAIALITVKQPIFQIFF